MRAGQKLYNDNGIQVALFPIDCMYITQGEHGSVSHTLAMDFVGWSPETGQINHYPYYAPFDCKLVDYSISGAWYVWESTSEVQFADGTIDFMTIVVMHDDNPQYQDIGHTLSQGELLGRSGQSGYAFGDHIHINTAKGKYAGWSQGEVPGFNELTNSTHIYNSLYVNDTTLYEDYGYNWKTFQGGGPIPPTPTHIPKRKKFPWFIYNQRKISRLFF